MGGLYNCPYVFRNGEVCNRGCYRPEGCYLHHKSPERNPCGECGELTHSKYGYCNKHAGKYRKREQYNRKKAGSNIIQNEVETVSVSQKSLLTGC